MIKHKGVFLPLFLLLFWHLLATSGFWDSSLLPSPSIVWKTTLQSFESGLLWDQLLISISRIISGFLIAFFLALPLAILLGKIKDSIQWIGPLLNFSRLTPAIALLPLLLLWFSNQSTAILMVVILSAFFPIFISCEYGFRTADPKLVEVGESLSLSKENLFRKIIFPCALPSIIIGMRLGISYSWRALIGSEIVLAVAGVGSLLMQAHTEARVDKIIMLVLITGLLGTLVDWILAKLVSDWLPWCQEVGSYDGN